MRISLESSTARDLRKQPTGAVVLQGLSIPCHHDQYIAPALFWTGQDLCVTSTIQHSRAVVGARTFLAGIVMSNVWLLQLVDWRGKQNNPPRKRN